MSLSEAMSVRGDAQRGIQASYMDTRLLSILQAYNAFGDPHVDPFHDREHDKEHGRRRADRDQFLEIRPKGVRIRNLPPVNNQHSL